MIDLLVVLVLLVVALGVGLRLLGWLDAVPGHRLDAAALGLPIGLGLISLGSLAIGQFGVLNRLGLAVLLGAAGVLGWHAHGFAWACASRSTDEGEHARPKRWACHPARAAYSLVLVATFVCALVPVTDGDALCYHLQVPKVWLAAGGPTFEPDLHETVYPALVETLYAIALAFAGPVACRLVQWTLGVCFAGLVTAVARPHLGERANWAGLIALLTPAVTNGMSAPLNDVALAAYGMAALQAWSLWHDRPTARRAILVGLCCGLAVGVKYPALVWSGLIGLGMFGATIPRPGRDRVNGRLFHPLLFTAALIAIGGCWYLRAYHYTGNPVFPFFRGTFGGAGLDEVLDPIKRPLDPSPLNLLTALAPMTLQPDRFDSFSHQFGPAFLLFLPAILVMRPPRRIAAIVGLGYAFLVVCLTQRQSMRFVLIAVGPMAVGVAWVASRWAVRGGLAARTLSAALGLVLVFEAGIAAARTRHAWPVALGFESREMFLARREPTHRVGRWVANHLPADARLIGQDHRGFYFPTAYTMELAHRRRTGLGTRGEGPDEVVAALRERGFTHLVMCPPEPETAVEFDPTLGRLLADWLPPRTPLYSESITDPDGVTRRYAIYDLSAKPGLATAGREPRR